MHLFSLAVNDRDKYHTYLSLQCLLRVPFIQFSQLAFQPSPYHSLYLLALRGSSRTFTYLHNGVATIPQPTTTCVPPLTYTTFSRTTVFAYEHGIFGPRYGIFAALLSKMPRLRRSYVGIVQARRQPSNSCVLTRPVVLGHCVYCFFGTSICRDDLSVNSC